MLDRGHTYMYMYVCVSVGAQARVTGGVFLCHTVLVCWYVHMLRCWYVLEGYGFCTDIKNR